MLTREMTSRSSRSGVSRSFQSTAICGCLLVLLGVISSGSAQQKKRVAVLNFDYGTVQSSVSGVFGTNVDVGKGISDLLVEKLVQDSKCSVIERSALDKILNEQNLSNSDRADSSTAVKIGRLLGVDAVIIGTITEFGRDDKNTTLGASGKVGDFTSKWGLGGVQKQHAKAVVAITARLIDTSTAEILAAVTGSGESTRAGTSLLGGGGGNGSATGGYDMSSKNFGDTILGEAVHKAVDSVGTQLETQVVAMATRKPEVGGLVADVSDSTLILNIGSNAGVHVGEILEVTRPTRTVKDPTTGKVLKTVSSKIGTASVTEVDEQSATATFTGSGTAKVGDAVHPVSAAEQETLTPVQPPAPAAPAAPQGLTNQDVITMVKGGLGENMILRAIDSQDTNFDISAKGLLQLKKAGVPPKIMDAVVTAAGKRKTAEEAAAKAQSDAAAKNTEGTVVPAVMSSPILPTQPAVLIAQGALKQPMPTAHAQIVQTKTKPATLAALTSDASLAQATANMNAAAMGAGKPSLANAAMMANPVTAPMVMAGSLFSHRKQTVTDVWLIVGAKSDTIIRNPQPSFEVLCDSVPGISAEEYQPVLLKLESSPNNFRLVGATQAKSDALQQPNADWGLYSSFVEERVPGQVTKVAPGHYQLHATSALAPGEYGVALRPVNKDKKFAGSNVSQNMGDGLVFNSLWSFEVAQ
jgi:curli biogenesis system outer membrane secretion channel CsgG